MKKFEIPEIEVVHFEKDDVISTSTCVCVDCKECPPGSNNCRYHDTCPMHVN